MFLFPKKTAASAIHPLPALMFGTKADNLSTYIIPPIPAHKALKHHAMLRYRSSGILRACNKSPLLATTLVRSPHALRYKNTIIRAEAAKHKTACK